jgi:hypothetical protein
MGMHRQQRLRAIEDEQRFGAIPLDHIAGAVVVRPISIGDVALKRGAELTRAQLLAMGSRNFRAMVTNRYLELIICADE